MAQSIDLDARAEVVVRVNPQSFRVAARVRGRRDASATCMEFLEISARAREALEEALERLAKLQVLTRKLRSGRLDVETQRALMENPHFRLSKPGEITMVLEPAEETVVPTSSVVVVEAEEVPRRKDATAGKATICMDVFG